MKKQSILWMPTILCLFTACEEWKSFDPVDCSETETGKYQNNGEDYYRCDKETNYKYQLESLECRLGAVGFREISYENLDSETEKQKIHCVQQKCVNNSWVDDTDDLQKASDKAKIESCVSNGDKFVGFGECINGTFSCSEDGATKETPFKLCSNGQLLEFGRCGCASDDNEGDYYIDDGQKVSCENGIWKQIEDAPKSDA